jgi:hypothetical protein
VLDVLQAGAEVLVQPTAAVAREVFWELSDVLLAPCSLFDAGDTLLLHRSMMELANSNTEQAAAMQAAFFNSSKVRLEGGGDWQQEEGGELHPHLLPCAPHWWRSAYGGWGFPHLRVSASFIPVGNAIDVWRMCLRVTFSPPKICHSIKATLQGGCGP